MIIREHCEKCLGNGYTVEMEHEPGCDGNCQGCPIQVQYECGYCLGLGYWDYEEPNECN